jgi:hypothetical protein
MKTGRPTKYSEELIAEICERIADGESLRKICGEDRMPDRASVFRWLKESSAFRKQYALARDWQADALADEMLEIADDSRNDFYTDGDGKRHVNYENIARSKLRIAARQWLAERLAPKKYGSRLDVEHSGDVDIRVVIGGDAPSTSALPDGARMSLC